MQSPLTPQRGRIESNPREYTHMGPSTNLPHERGFSDEIIRRRSKCRPIVHSRTPFVSNREMRDVYERWLYSKEPNN